MSEILEEYGGVIAISLVGLAIVATFLGVLVLVAGL